MMILFQTPSRRERTPRVGDDGSKGATTTKQGERGAERQKEEEEEEDQGC